MPVFFAGAFGGVVDGSEGELRRLRDVVRWCSVVARLLVAARIMVWQVAWLAGWLGGENTVCWAVTCVAWLTVARWFSAGVQERAACAVWLGTAVALRHEGVSVLGCVVWTVAAFSVAQAVVLLVWSCGFGQAVANVGAASVQSLPGCGQEEVAGGARVALGVFRGLCVTCGFVVDVNRHVGRCVAQSAGGFWTVARSALQGRVVGGAPPEVGSVCRECRLVVASRDHWKYCAMADPVGATVPASRTLWAGEILHAVGFAAMKQGAVQVLGLDGRKKEKHVAFAEKKFCTGCGMIVNPVGHKERCGGRVTAALAAGVVEIAGKVQCAVCGFVVRAEGHADRCRPVVDRNVVSGLRRAAWLGDALHTVDVRVALLLAGLEDKQLQVEATRLSSATAQAAFYKQWHGRKVKAASGSEDKLAQAFEASYNGRFRRRYIRDVLLQLTVGKRIPPVPEMMSELQLCKALEWVGEDGLVM